MGSIGVVCLIGAFVFRWAAPCPDRLCRGGTTGVASRQHQDSENATPHCRGCTPKAFLLMGSFITIYNYVELSLARAAVFTEPVRGRCHFPVLHRRLVRLDLVWPAGRPVGPAPGLLDTHPHLPRGCWNDRRAPLLLIILGIGVATAGYFGAHSVASSWVSRRGHAAPAQAAAFYLFFLYVGSSVLGSAGGVAWTRAGWPGVAAFVVCCW